MRITPDNFDRVAESAILTMEETAGIARRSVSTLYRDAQKGAIKITKVGKQARVTAGELRRFLRGGGQ